MHRSPLTVTMLRRRRLIGLIAGATCTVSCPSFAQRTLEPTPSQTEGPFYPRTLPEQRDADLTRTGERSDRARGTPLYLSGRVLGVDGQPLANARLELWQCDALGRYHYVGDPGPLDDAFQGYGVATTDAQGRYGFITIRPVAYPGRPPHMHFKLHHASARDLTTQLYVLGDDTAGDGVLANSPRGTLQRLSVRLTAADDREPGALAASFDFVLAPR